ncbi:transcription termination factor 5, mitochondrial-like [Bombyx mandarina]|uniref:Transcription termination factor 5, mitochondrial-like n=1 Tax=Bombyx mandarina TaxID=7092 RepID=A0A6J2KCW3_BOMMA|nr:transcription termination factor 5, mitochondrial-like [Bombyx mandarina]
MGIYVRNLLNLRGSSVFISNLKKLTRRYSNFPFLDLHQQITGQNLSSKCLEKIKRQHPNIDKLRHDQLKYTIQILNKFNITPLEACENAHIFCMNSITMDNYGEILRECQFIKIVTKHIIKYHTLVRSRTIAKLKKDGLIKADLNLEKVLQDCFHDWPESNKRLHHFTDSTTSILQVRMCVLENYLKWRLSIETDEFQKYCKHYMSFKHKPMSDIREALDIAQNVIKFDTEVIRRNGFIISSDPVNTKLILENVESLAGFEIHDAIKIEPAILKNNYNALLEMKSILEEYRIPLEAQRRCLKIYCMCPETVRERLKELASLKEYQVLSTNPRVLSMVVHKKKMLSRLSKIQAAKKQCYSLNHLISSSKVFNNYISNFGNKVCGRDIAILISSSLNREGFDHNKEISESERLKEVLQQLRRHKFWLHTALDVVCDNLQFLKSRFNDRDIIKNCQLVLYPVTEIEQYITKLLDIRDNKEIHSQDRGNMYYNNLNYEKLTGEQILSLVLYEIEKKYHFSGDGIWGMQDGVKVESRV